MFLEVSEFISGNMNYNYTFRIEVLRLGILFFIFLWFGHHFFDLLLKLHLLGLDALVQGLPAAFNVTIYDHLTALIGIEGLTDGALRDVICLLLTIFKLGL